MTKRRKMFKALLASLIMGILSVLCSNTAFAATAPSVTINCNLNGSTPTINIKGALWDNAPTFTVSDSDTGDYVSSVTETWTNSAGTQLYTNTYSFTQSKAFKVSGYHPTSIGSYTYKVTAKDSTGLSTTETKTIQCATALHLPNTTTSITSGSTLSPGQSITATTSTTNPDGIKMIRLTIINDYNQVQYFNAWEYPGTNPYTTNPINAPTTTGKYYFVYQILIEVYNGTTNPTYLENKYIPFTVAVPATAPAATNVSISGTPTVGQTLTGNYTYNDTNGDTESGSTYKWLRNGTAISGATSKTYVLTSSDQGCSIIFEVTPKTTVAPIAGTAVQSSAVTVNAVASAPINIPFVMVPAGVEFNLYYSGEFSGADTWKYKDELGVWQTTSSPAGKVTVTPEVGLGYTKITGKFDAPGLKLGSIGTTGVKIYMNVIAAPTNPAIQISFE